MYHQLPFVSDEEALKIAQELNDKYPDSFAYKLQRFSLEEWLKEQAYLQAEREGLQQY